MQRLVGQRRLTNRELERALMLAGRSPGVALRSNLAQGTTAGGVILVLDGKFDAVAGSASADNRSSKALGEWQGILQLRANQLLGLGEQAYVYVSGDVRPSRALRSGAPRRVAGGGISLPVGTAGRILNPEITWSDTFSVATALTPRIESKFQRFTLRATVPIVLSRQEELSVTDAFEVGQQQNTAPDFGTLLQEDRLRMLRLGTDWARPAPWDTARLRLSTTLSKGLSGLGARTPADAAVSGVALLRAGSRPDFSKIEAGLALDQRLPAGVKSRTLVRLQKAHHAPFPAPSCSAWTARTRCPPSAPAAYRTQPIPAGGVSSPVRRGPGRPARSSPVRTPGLAPTGSSASRWPRRRPRNR